MWATIAAPQGDSSNPREFLRAANLFVISSNRETLCARNERDLHPERKTTQPTFSPRFAGESWQTVHASA
jgi:hypothetical protein